MDLFWASTFQTGDGLGPLCTMAVTKNLPAFPKKSRVTFRLEKIRIPQIYGRLAGFGATFFHLFLDGPMFVLGDGLVDPSSFSISHDSRAECQGEWVIFR